MCLLRVLLFDLGSLLRDALLILIKLLLHFAELRLQNLHLGLLILLVAFVLVLLYEQLVVRRILAHRLLLLLLLIVKLLHQQRGLLDSFVRLANLALELVDAVLEDLLLHRVRGIE